MLATLCMTGLKNRETMANDLRLKKYLKINFMKRRNTVNTCKGKRKRKHDRKSKGVVVVCIMSFEHKRESKGVVVVCLRIVSMIVRVRE